MSSTPRVSIGMPVFNGAATIEESVAALLAQTFGDFELIVSDNASTDDTRDVVEALAARDGRVRYVRQPTNLGANGNYSYVAMVARGEYLKWASASDWCAPTFLERCLAALDQHPDAVLAAPRTRLYEGDRSTARDYADDVEIPGATPSLRLHQLDERLRLNNALNGVIRLSALRQTHLIEPYQQADMVLMGHLALLGKFLLVDDRLFYRRMEPATATALQDADAVRRHHYPTPTARALFQTWRRHAGWLQAAFSVPMPFSERRKVLAFVARQIYWDRRALASDLAASWRYAARARG